MGCLQRANERKKHNWEMKNIKYFANNEKKYRVN